MPTYHFKIGQKELVKFFQFASWPDLPEDALKYSQGMIPVPEEDGQYKIQAIPPLEEEWPHFVEGSKATWRCYDCSVFDELILADGADQCHLFRQKDGSWKMVLDCESPVSGRFARAIAALHPRHGVNFLIARLYLLAVRVGSGDPEAQTRRWIKQMRAAAAKGESLFSPLPTQERHWLSAIGKGPFFRWMDSLDAKQKKTEVA